MESETSFEAIFPGKKTKEFPRTRYTNGRWVSYNFFYKINMNQNMVPSTWKTLNKNLFMMMVVGVVIRDLEQLEPKRIFMWQIGLFEDGHNKMASIRWSSQKSLFPPYVHSMWPWHTYIVMSRYDLDLSLYMFPPSHPPQTFVTTVPDRMWQQWCWMTSKAKTQYVIGLLFSVRSPSFPVSLSFPLPLPSLIVLEAQPPVWGRNPT